MKIWITSGGTTEKIDDVRGITNHSTGYLGKEIAELFLAKGHQVTLVTVKTAVKPEPKENLKITEITNVDSLLKSMEPLVKEHDVLIHSMAISDYTPIYMTDFTELEDTENPSQLLHKSNTESKISSASDYQVLFLKKTPKIISLVKQWNPNIQLVGFNFSQMSAKRIFSRLLVLVLNAIKQTLLWQMIWVRLLQINILLI